MPGVPPVTTPDVRPMVATVVLLLTHVPPAAVLLNVAVFPWHIAVIPDIGERVTTVTIAVEVHPGAT